MRIRLLFISLLSFIALSCTDIAFDSEKWKNWELKSSENHLRYDMSDDLVENYNLVGKSRQDILNLLGDPDSIKKGLKEKYFYNLGPCRRGIDFGVLYIYFENDLVVKIDKFCH